MRLRLRGMLIPLLLAAGVTSVSPRPSAAEQRLRVAVIPTQYFSADAESAENVTQGLVRQFERQGYDVLPLERSRATLSRMGLDDRGQLSDPKALDFGRRMGADLVAYPRLLAVGVSAFGKNGGNGEPAPSAVLALRVLNARTGQPVYFRQVRHSFAGERPPGQRVTLSPQMADQVAEEATRPYFTRVAGSRQEFRRGR
jgi:hypothetical protein